MSKDVLIIDDEPWFFAPFLERLEYEGITYDCCKTGTDGLNKLMVTGYGAVVLDMKVSLGEDFSHIVGYEVPGIYILERIKETKPVLPVICYTVLSGQEIKDQILALGAKFVVKGGDEDALINEIKKIIGN
jgi:DNA-binding response OmpR family regulator